MIIATVFALVDESMSSNKIWLTKQKLLLLLLIIILLIPVNLTNAIQIETCFSRVDKTISCQIPKLCWFPKKHDFGYVVEGKIYETEFDIWNNGTGQMPWNLDPCKQYIHVNPRSGISSGERDTIQVKLNTSDLSPGGYEGNIVIHSAGDYLFYTSFIITGAVLSVNPVSYDFGIVHQNEIRKTNITILNTGVGEMQWDITTLNPSIMVQPEEGVISNNEYKEIQLTITTNHLDYQPNMMPVFINSTGGNAVCSLFIDVNVPPDCPKIFGENKGKTKEKQMFYITAKDNDNDSVYYFCDWGDGSNSSWIGPFPSNEKIKLNHTWKKPGNYDIKVKAKDTHHLQGDWSKFLFECKRQNNGITWMIQRFKCHHIFQFL